MTALNTIIEILKENIFDIFVSSLNQFSILNQSLPFGNGSTTLSEIISIVIVGIVIYLVVFFPIILVYRVIKRLGV